MSDEKKVSTNSDKLDKCVISSEVNPSENKENNQINVVVEKSRQEDKDALKITVLEPGSEMAEQIVISSQPKKEKRENKVLNIVMVVVNIATNVGLLFFLNELLRGFNFSGGTISYNFNTFRVIGIIIFLLAQITGVYLTIKFIAKQSLLIKLVVVSAPLTLIFLGGVWALLSINNFKGEGELAVINFLNLTNFDPSTFDFKYVVIALAIYLIILYVLFALLLRNGRRAKVTAKTVAVESEDK